ncbi:hypothetical protein AB6F62_16510 [Providencia huaxiensis]|uniref:hypothetical protein n=1 Tax=Providencia huaxiensis TaxID=2027290 RepID=UPI0034DD092B
MFDKVMFSANKPMPIEPICVQIDRDPVVDKSFGDIFDGKWLVDGRRKISVRELTRIPIQRVRVSGVGMAF